MALLHIPYYFIFSIVLEYIFTCPDGQAPVTYLNVKKMSVKQIVGMQCNALGGCSLHPYSLMHTSVALSLLLRCVSTAWADSPRAWDWANDRPRIGFHVTREEGRDLLYKPVTSHTDYTGSLNAFPCRTQTRTFSGMTMYCCSEVTWMPCLPVSRCAI